MNFLMVYVDDMRPTKRTKRWSYNKACHLVADTIDELHLFARRLKLKRVWFQDGTLPHYDLTGSKRTMAIMLGVEAISDGQLVELIRKNRKGE